MMSLRGIHAGAGAMALALVAVFWTSTVVSEAFGSLEAIRLVKISIAWTVPLMALALAAAGATGRKLAGASGSPAVQTKTRRMMLAAANGIFVLVPCAIFLAVKAARLDLDPVFYSVQALELLAGALNMGLLGANLRAGLRMKRARKLPGRPVAA